MAIDHYGHPLVVGSVIEIMPVKAFKTVLGWYRKIARMRKHGRRGTITVINAVNSDLTFTGLDGASHLIPSRYVKKIS